MTQVDTIFGMDSRGATPEEFAALNSFTFVRSHMQLALDSENATGRKLTATEALEAFGLEFVKRVIDDGGAGIISDAAEPAKTIRERRRTLRLSRRALASATGLSVEDIIAAETPGTVVPIRSLEKIAQTLALDERLLGYTAAAHGDQELGIRLRELNDRQERDDAFITKLSEAAWVVRRQSELSSLLHADKDLKSKFVTKSGNYDEPAWRRGYDLAEKTRKILGIAAASPIPSMYALAQDQLGFPVIDTDLGQGIAGATIINGAARGVALNTEGVNRNILVRRMTLAHELGHLLWDPDHRLERVRVDNSSDLSRRDIRDVVEARANAFAIALLAPLAAVKRVYAQSSSPDVAIASVVEEYGISPAAAANHIANVCALDARAVSTRKNAPVSTLRYWEERERQNNLLTNHVPSSRGSRFALLTVQAVRRKLITRDTASAWLNIDQRYLADFL